jgi:hypothetical protein
MLHNVFLAEHSNAADFAVIFAYRKTEAGIMKYRAMRSIVYWMLKSQIATSAVWKNYIYGSVIANDSHERAFFETCRIERN